MRNVPAYTRPRSPEILKVSLRDAGPVSISPPPRHPSLANPRNTLLPASDIKGGAYRGVTRSEELYDLGRPAREY